MTPRTAYILFAIFFGIIMGLLVMVRINPLVEIKDDSTKTKIVKDTIIKTQTFPDTLNIRLLNMPGARVLDSHSKTKYQPVFGGESNEKPANKKPVIVESDTFHQAGRWLPENKYPVSALSNSGSVIAAQNMLLAKDQQRQRGMWWSALIGLIMLVVLVQGRHILNRRLSIEDILNRGEDVNLVNIIKNNEPAIKQLGNPRKIKRFVNKLKFQFYYLNNKQLFAANETANLQYFFEAFKIIQANTMLMNNDTKLLADIKAALKKQMTIGYENEDILNALLKLNMDVVG